METRTPSISSRLFHFLGLGARIPPPCGGPFQVKSLHVRLPSKGDWSLLTQIFYPLENDPASTAVAATAAASANEEDDDAQGQDGSWRRHYRNGVLRGTSVFSKTPAFVLDLFLGAAEHPLARAHASSLPVKSQGLGKLPVLLFSHGLGGNCEVYTKTASDLASHGYVVVCFEHEDGTASHAKTHLGDLVEYKPPPQGMKYTRENVVRFRAPFLEKRVQEIKTILDFLRAAAAAAAPHEDGELGNILSSIDVNNMALGGHSFGAASSVMMARQFPDAFKALLLLDIWSFPIPELESGVNHIPILSILSENFKESEESRYTKQLLGNSNRAYASFYMPGVVHSSFSDTAFWAPKLIGTRFQLRGELEPEVAQKSFIHACTAFLDFAFQNDLAKLESFQSDMLREDPQLQSFPIR